MSEIVKKPSAQQLPTILSPAAEQYLRESLSQNTRRAYRAQISKWVEWCAQKRVEPWPADLVQVVNYLSERADAGQAVSPDHASGVRKLLATVAQGVEIA